MLHVAALFEALLVKNNVCREDINGAGMVCASEYGINTWQTDGEIIPLGRSAIHQTAEMQQGHTDSAYSL